MDGFFATTDSIPLAESRAFSSCSGCAAIRIEEVPERIPQFLEVTRREIFDRGELAQLEKCLRLETSDCSVVSVRRRAFWTSFSETDTKM